MFPSCPPVTECHRSDSKTFTSLGFLLRHDPKCLNLPLIDAVHVPFRHALASADDEKHRQGFVSVGRWVKYQDRGKLKREVEGIKWRIKTGWWSRRRK